MHVVTEAFRAVGGDACVDSMRDGYTQTSALSPAEVSDAFHTCTRATESCHAAQLASLVMDWAPTAAELGSYPASNVNRSQTAWACAQMAGASSGLQAYMALLAPMEPGQCLNITWAPCSPEGGEGGGSALSGFCGAEWKTPNSGCQDGWGIESCTTEIHPISTNNVTDFFPPSPPFDEAAVQAGCRSTYGNDLRTDGAAMPRSFGQIDLARMAASASRIIFSSGQFDPWSSMSVNQSLSDTLPFVYIAGGAHHSDIGNNWNPEPTPDDEPALVAARAEETAILNRWIAEFHAERRAAKARLAQ